MLRQPRPLVPFTFPFAGQSYARRLLNTQPAALLADWQLGETTGSNAANAEGTSARDGTYTNGPTLNAATFTDGTPAPSFDGSDDRVNIYSSSLDSAFNGQEGTAFIWAKVSGSGIWSDGITHTLVFLGVDVNNRVFLTKSTTTNQLRLQYIAGGTSLVITDTSLAGTINWFSLAMTWSKSADQMKAYINGVQVGGTQSGLGTWTGSLNALSARLGASNSGGLVWSGFLKYAALWSTPLSAGEIAALATV